MNGVYLKMLSAVLSHAKRGIVFIWYWEDRVPLNSPLQLSLPVHLPDDETFNSYYPAAGNDELIQNWANAEGQGEAAIYLWGPVKSGRTHLMHAACAHANEVERRSFYIP